MRHVFWLIPELLDGRAGPNREPWDIGELARAGFRAVLSVNDGELCHAEDFTRLGMAYACLPLSANAPPRRGDLQQCLDTLPEAYDFVSAQIGKRRPALIHCSSGKDRTCLLMAYFLMRHDAVAPDDAVAQVRALRPIAFTAEGWESFAFAVLRESRKTLPRSARTEPLDA
ncbi:MAG TPA: dual specificity protein phosphatase family protein [Gammaproteobacteria bacterium]|nr:dual specificity protein phosphatase family protein [Gammaproteobacteria bacterium]